MGLKKRRKEKYLKKIAKLLKSKFRTNSGYTNFYLKYYKLELLVEKYETLIKRADTIKVIRAASKKDMLVDTNCGYKSFF